VAEEFIRFKSSGISGDDRAVSFNFFNKMSEFSPRSRSRLNSSLAQSNLGLFYFFPFLAGDIRFPQYFIQKIFPDLTFVRVGNGQS
jgi:hypothetical protein